MMYMRGKIQEIEGINFEYKRRHLPSDSPASIEDKFELRDMIVERIRRIAGKNSIRRVVPVQSLGDHKSQEIIFEMDDSIFTATVRYNNEMTLGWVADLVEAPDKC